MLSIMSKILSTAVVADDVFMPKGIELALGLVFFQHLALIESR